MLAAWGLSRQGLKPRSASDVAMCHSSQAVGEYISRVAPQVRAAGMLSGVWKGIG
jgi:hypothetical protein